MNAAEEWGTEVAGEEIERTFKLLNVLAQTRESLSQRELSQELGIALGLVNSYLKRLIRKGYIKVTTLPRNRLGYILTPQGVAEKSRLAYKYASFSYRLYRATRQRCRKLMDHLEEEGNSKVVLFGSGEAAEIAYLSMLESELELIAVVEGQAKEGKFFGFRVQGLEELKGLDYHRLIVAVAGQQEEIEAKLQQAGVEAERVCWLEEGGWFSHP